MADQTLSIQVEVVGAEQGAVKIKGVSGAVKTVGDESETTAKKTSGLRNTLSGLATGFAVYKGAQFIKGAVTETTNLAKATASLQRITGMDTKTASGWVGVARERGVQSKQLNMGFISLSKQISAASSGSKASAQAFQQLGLSGAQLKAVGMPTALGLIADSFKSLPAGADKATLAQKLFGRQAQTLLPLLNQGSKGLNDQVGAMAKQQGMTGQTMKSGLELVKQQREWSATMTGIKVAIATALLPAMVALSGIIQPIASAFASAGTGGMVFRTAVLSLTAALTTFIVVMKVVNLLGKDFELSWGLIPAVLVAIGVALYLLYTKCAWFRNAVNGAIGGVVAAFNWMKQAASNAFNWIKSNWPLLVSILGGPIAAAAVQIAKHWGDIKGAAVTAFNAIKSAASAVGSVVGSALGGAFNTVKSAINGVVSGINAIVNAAQKVASLPSKALSVLTGGVSGVVSSLNPFHQHGGYMSSAGTALVGEHGPEMVHLPQGAHVSPFLQGGVGGGAAQIHTHVYLGPRQIALAVGDYVAGQQAAR